MNALLRALVTSLIVWAGGCCLSAQQVDERFDSLVTRNRAGAQPAMQAAAEARGATLLPVKATYISNRPRVCAEGTGRAPLYAGHDACRLMAGDDECIVQGKDGRSFVLHGKDGTSKLAIVITAVDGWRYTRLARRGNRMFILRPRLSPGKVKRAVQCECDGMPRVVCPSAYVFLTDDVLDVEVDPEEIWVPVIDERLEIDCKGMGV